MKYKQQIFLFTSLIFLALVVPSVVQATPYFVNYTVTPSDSASPQFAIQALQYSPYPVSAGNWFDVWVKVQNIGTDNAPDAEFQLVPTYPFEATNDLVQDFGIIPGTWAAHSNQVSLGDSSSQSNFVLMKFRVKVADNAPEGENLLQIKATANKKIAGSTTYYLPITIGKTKTDFTVVLQSATSGLSLSIANTGSNPATAVAVSIPQQQGVSSSGTSSSIIGNLAGGDFTTVSFQSSLRPNVKNLSIDIAYTDIAGVRNTVQENLSIDSSQSGGLNGSSSFGGRNGTYGASGRAAAASQSSSTPSWIYLLVGAVAGWSVVSLKRRNKHGKHENK